MKTFLLIPLMIVLVSGLIFAGCAKPAPPPVVKPIKIGVLMPLTGMFSSEGTELTQALEILLEDFNHEVVGRPIEIIMEDSGGADPATILAKARKLVEADKVHVIVGPHHTGLRLALLPYLSQVPILNFCYSQAADTELEFGGWSVLPNGLMASVGRPMGMYAYDVMGLRVAATLGTDYECSYAFIKGFTDAFMERGGTIVQQKWVPFDVVDFTPYLTAIPPEAEILVTSLVPTVRSVACLKQFHELGLGKKMQTTPLTSTSFYPEIMQEVGDIGLGCKGSGAYHWTLDTPVNRKFAPAYEARYGYHPHEAAGGWGYDVFSTILRLIEATGGDTTPEVMKEAILELEIESTAGPLTFSRLSVGRKPMYVFEDRKVGDIYDWVVVKKYLPEEVFPEPKW